MPLLIICGCSSAGDPPAKTSVEARLELVAELLAMHVVETGRRPASEAAFRQYVEEHGRESLRHHGIGNVDELFTSPRDGQKLVILYEGQRNQVRGEIWAYEAEGHGGTRAIVDSLGRARFMPEEDFERLLAGSSS